MKALRMVLCTAVLLFLSSFLLFAQEADMGALGPDVEMTDVSWGSLLPEITEFGKISLSVDGLGTLASSGTIQVEKPVGATVRGAYFLVATTGGRGYHLPNGTGISLNGTGVTWTHETISSFNSYNYWADVTSIVKPTIDAAPPGIINLTVSEGLTSLIDGSVLAVIFNDPNQTFDNTIVLLYGAQNVNGDQFNIGLADPIDKSDPNLKLDMSLGISYGYRPSGQYSIVEVNSQRLSTSAGGQDDGDNANGALITVGGVGDTNANPPDPLFQEFSTWSYDDELYDILPFVNDGDTQIMVFSRNPSNDDNIFFASFYIASTVAVVGEGILLAQEFDTNMVGENHTVTATLQDDDGNPIVGRMVAFEILSGPHAGLTASAATDQFGKAAYTYTGTAPGVDMIIASFVNSQSATVESNTLEKEWLEDQEYELVSVFDGAQAGMLDMYCYIWDNVNKCYRPISSDPSDVDSDVLLPPWTGYYVLVDTDLDLLTPDTNPAPPPAAPDLEILNDRYYLISPPVDPAANRDINANWGDDLGSGDYERTWRVVKWRYVEEDYPRYNGPTANTFLDLHPGRGFYLLQLTGSTVMLDMPGSLAPTTDIAGTDYHMVKMPGPVANTGHMAGNPFTYGIYWKDCMVRVPMTASQLSKIAAVNTEQIEKWHIGLAVNSQDNTVKDLYNRVGVVTTPGINSDFLDAIDLAPMGEYVNLTLLNPEREERLAYDYRSAGDLMHQWEIELTTSFNSIDAVLSVDSFEFVPSDYIISLEDQQTGEIYQLAGGESIDVRLSSAMPSTFIMTAEKSVVGAEELAAPLAFGITSINPNPFNPTTTIIYNIEHSGHVGLYVYNLNGQLVESLVDGFVDTGTHSVVWNAGSYASGIYFVSIDAHGMKDVRKVTLMK